MKHMFHPRMIWKLACPCMAAAALVLATGCKPEVRREAAPPIVRVETPVVQSVPVWKEWVGTLTGVVNASILPQVSGYVESQNYTDGSAVKKGDLLFRIEPTIYKDQVNQAAAQLSEAQAQWKQADLNKRIYGPLVAEDAVSKQKYQDAIIAVQNAEAGILAAEAALSIAKRNLGYTEIVSPIDGVGGFAAVQVGDFVSPSGKVMTEISSITPIRLDFSVTQREWLEQTQQPEQGGISQGEKLTVILSNNTVYPHQAEVTAIGRAFDSQTGTMGIQARLDNPGQLLRPGMFVRVRALMNTQENVLTVPQKAIYTTQGRFFVILVGPDDIPRIIPVNAGTKTGTSQVVIPLEKGSLNADSRIVVEGVQEAMMAASRGGIPVTVAPSPASSAQ